MDSIDRPPGGRQDATLAQSVEQLIRNQQVVGSNPTGGSTKSREFEDFIAHLRANPSETLQIVRKLSEYVKFNFLTLFNNVEMSRGAVSGQKVPLKHQRVQ